MCAVWTAVAVGVPGNADFASATNFDCASLTSAALGVLVAAVIPGPGGKLVLEAELVFGAGLVFDTGLVLDAVLVVGAVLVLGAGEVGTVGAVVRCAVIAGPELAVRTVVVERTVALDRAPIALVITAAPAGMLPAGVLLVLTLPLLPRLVVAVLLAAVECEVQPATARANTATPTAPIRRFISLTVLAIGSDVQQFDGNEDMSGHGGCHCEAL